MTTALTAYLTSTNDATSLSSTARTLAATAPSTGSTLTTKVAKTTQWVQLFSRGTTTSQTGVASIGSPTGNGWILDDTSLETNQFPAGNYTPSIKVNASSALTCTVQVRVYKFHSGTYTLIASATSSSIALTSVLTALVFPTPGSGSLTTFNTGDKLYVDVWANISVASTSTTATIGIEENAGATDAVVTPGYDPQPRTFSQSALATATTAPTYVRAISVTQPTSVSALGSVNRMLALFRTVSTTATTLGFVQAGKVMLLSLATTATTTAARTLSVGKSVAATVSSAPSLARRVGKVAALTVTSTPVVRRVISKTLAATSSITNVLSASKVQLLHILATASTAPTLVRQVGKHSTATSTTTPGITRAIAKTVKATAAQTTGALVRSIQKRLSGGVTTTATVSTSSVRLYLRTLLASVSATSSVSRTLSLSQLVAATATTTASFTRAMSKKVATGVSSAASAVVQSFGQHTYQVLAAAVAQMAPVVSRTIGKRFTAIASTPSLLGMVRVIFGRLRHLGAAAEVYPTRPASGGTAVTPPAIMESGTRATAESGLFSTDD